MMNAGPNWALGPHQMMGTYFTKPKGPQPAPKDRNLFLFVKPNGIQPAPNDKNLAFYKTK